LVRLRQVKNGHQGLRTQQDQEQKQESRVAIANPRIDPLPD
jgi:hypothetical protein